MKKIDKNLINIIDPFGEEDWLEEEILITVFKVRITAITKRINIFFFSPIIDKISDKIILKENLVKFYIDLENSFNTNVKNGIINDNYYIIHNDYFNDDKLFNFVEKYLYKRKKQSIENINELETMIRDYEHGYIDDEDDIDIYEIKENLDKELLLINKINNFDIKNETVKIINRFKNI